MMAENARPQTSVPLPSGLIAGLGDAATAAKVARKEIKELQREINAAVRRGEAVSPQITRRLDQAMRLEASLTQSIAQQKKLQQGIATTKADANALKFLMGAQAFRQFMESGMPDFRSFSMMVFASSGMLQELAAKHFGEKAMVTRLAKSFGVVAPFVGEAVQSTIEAIEKHKANKADLRKLAADFESGKYSEAERERLNQFIDEQHRVFGGDPKKIFEDFVRLAERIGGADEEMRRKVITPAVKKTLQDMDMTVHPEALPFFHWPWEKQDLEAAKFKKQVEIGAIKALRAADLDARMQDALDAKARELGYDKAGIQFTPEQEAFIRRHVVEGLLGEIKGPQRDELLRLIDQGMKTYKLKKDNMFKSVAQLQREASEKYRQTEEKRMREIRFQRSRQRVALNGRIGE